MKRKRWYYMAKQKNSEKLLDELLTRIAPETLSSLLKYSAEYLRGHKASTVRPIDLERADMLEEYSEKLRKS